MKPSAKKNSKLEIANEMYKFAYLIKSQRFQELYPHLTSEEVHKKTRQYFYNLKPVKK